MKHEITLCDSDETDGIVTLDTCGSYQACLHAKSEGAAQYVVVYLSRIQMATLAAWLTAALIETKEATV